MTPSYSRRRLPRVRLYTDICDWQDWSRPRSRLVRHVEMRHSETGMPVVVMKPTLLGRIVMVWRSWRSCDR